MLILHQKNELPLLLTVSEHKPARRPSTTHTQQKNDENNKHTARTCHHIVGPSIWDTTRSSQGHVDGGYSLRTCTIRLLAALVSLRLLTPNTAWSGFLQSEAITKKSRCAAQAFLITAPYVCNECIWSHTTTVLAAKRCNQTCIREQTRRPVPPSEAG